MLKYNISFLDVQKYMVSASRFSQADFRQNCNFFMQGYVIWCRHNIRR